MASKPDREQRHAAREALDEAARRGELRLPEAVRALRKSLGLSRRSSGDWLG